MSKSGDNLKRMENAAKGLPMSGVTCYLVNAWLGTNYHFDTNGPRLSLGERVALQRVIERLKAKGIKPSQSLLTPHQRAAIRKRRSK